MYKPLCPIPGTSKKKVCRGGMGLAVDSIPNSKRNLPLKQKLADPFCKMGSWSSPDERCLDILYESIY